MAEYTTQSQLRGAKPPPGKSGGAGRPQAAAASGGERVSTQVRETMVREAAYFRAERRDFAPGNELGDWLAAEREIDAALTQPEARRGR
ncbi:MAG TPA: DUF2934 domain-containing protein [Steroidobacteraceae bacterium]|nr:DUF2934 domain-containing protein [Steroidobacteraceae bacterium]